MLKGNFIATILLLCSFLHVRLHFVIIAAIWRVSQTLFAVMKSFGVSFRRIGATTVHPD